MAKISSPAVRFLLLLFFLFASGVASSTIVGGWTEIADVKTNKEVQELGRFSVEEYNRSRGSKARVGLREILRFGDVLEGQMQVVSGIKYHLKVLAVGKASEEQRIFDSVVVVQPWLHSKKLLGFAPSTDQHLHF